MIGHEFRASVTFLVGWLIVAVTGAARADATRAPSIGLDAPHDAVSQSLLYDFSGARDDNGSGVGHSATAVHCTNIGAVTAQVTVEFHANNGTVSSGTLSIVGSQTRTFLTDLTTVFTPDKVIDLQGVPLDQGWGQVFTSSRDLICTAQVFDPVNNPPTFLVNLPLFKH